MFERFSEGSRAVLVEAQDLALELGSHYITPMHLLYGCAAGREETAGRPLHDAGVTASSIRQLLPRAAEQAGGHVDPDALRAVGIDYAELRSAVEKTFGAGALESAPDRRVLAGRRRKPAFTPDAKRALELTLRVTVELHGKRILPGHIVLGILRLDNEYVFGAVEAAGTSVGALSAAVLTRLSAAA